MTRHVIIGNGIAGIRAAETIRSMKPLEEIFIIAGESFPPYSRPMISLLLEGKIEPDRLPIRLPNFYSSLNINAITGEKVVSIDVDRRRLATDQGKDLEYDQLLIASGAEPRPLKAPGAELEAVSCMRSEADVRKIVQALSGAKNALVLGGGLVGFKAAYALMRRGVKVTMLISSCYPLSMQVDAPAGQMILDELVANGLEVKVGIDVIAFEGNGRVREAHLSDGTFMECSLAIIGKGVVPSMSFVPGIKFRQTLE